jgi:hypothetical protein
VQRALRRPGEAGKSELRVIALQEKLVKAFPQVAAYRLDLARTQNALATHQLTLDQPARARDLAQDAAAQLNEALKLPAPDAGLRLALYDVDLTLMESQVRLGDHARAARTAGEAELLLDGGLPKGSSDPRREGHRVASVLARCAGLAEADANLPEAERKTLARSHSDRAMAWLKRAVAGGYRDVGTLRRAAAFQALRGRADFQELVAELERRAQK